METFSENIYRRYGIPNDLTDRLQKKKISVEGIRAMNRVNLQELGLSQREVKFLKSCVTRKPIDEKVAFRLLSNSCFTCCVCHGIKSLSYMIHHIAEHAKSQDNSYKNLAVLCPACHDDAHRPVGIANPSRSISQKEIRAAKSKWEKYCEENQRAKANSQETPSMVVAESSALVLDCIAFDYADSPLLHGWKRHEPDNDKPVGITRVYDKFYRETAMVDTTQSGPIEITISDKKGKIVAVRFIVKDCLGFVQARVLLQGTQQPQKPSLRWWGFREVGYGKEGFRDDINEDHFTLQPTSEHGWKVFAVEFDKFVPETVHKWSYVKLEKVLIGRGIMHIARIEIIRKPKLALA